MHAMKRAVITGAAAVALLTTVGAAATDESPGKTMGAGADPHVTLYIVRVDDGYFPESVFLAIIDVGLPGGAGSTITVTTGGGLSVELYGEDEVWDEEFDFADLASLKTGLDGTWTITVEGPDPSVSTFLLNADEFDESDFLDPPADVVPAHGDMDVPVDVVLSWSRPAGGETMDFLAVFAEPDGGGPEQSAFSLDGDIDLLATTWDPPLDLEPSCYEADVAYLSFGDEGLVGPLTGDIVWGSAPRTPVGYPASTPLLILGSDTIVGFLVEGARPEDLSNNGLVDFADILGVLGAWGPCQDCPEDIDGSGTVDFADILALLSAWGPCCE